MCVISYGFKEKGEDEMANKVSSKTHTQKQLNDYANQHNPNNKAYLANANNKNKMKEKSKHSKKHESGYVDLDWFQISNPFN